MRFHVELSREAQRQLTRFPRDVGERMEHAVHEFEFPSRGVVEISAILIKSKDTYR